MNMQEATQETRSKVFMVRGSDVSYIANQINAHKRAGMTTETLIITPALAAHILAKHNTGNRNLRANRVAELARAIREGAWRLTSQGISFSREGFLNNGQHRLAACIEADKPIQVRVTWGEDRDAFDVLDTGSLRRSGDVLQQLGYKDVNEVAAAARLLNFCTTGVPRVRNDEVVQIVSENPALADLSNKAASLAKKFRTSSAGMLYALFLITTKSVEAKRLDEFCALLSDGAMLSRYSPILAFREGLINRRLNSSVRHNLYQSEAIAACAIKAWNAWVSGQEMRLLRFNRDNEQFPAVK